MPAKKTSTDKLKTYLDSGKGVSALTAAKKFGFKNAKSFYSTVARLNNTGYSVVNQDGTYYSA
jgi:hypothetical protein